MDTNTFHSNTSISPRPNSSRNTATDCPGHAIDNANNIRAPENIQKQHKFLHLECSNWLICLCARLCELVLTSLWSFTYTLRTPVKKFFVIINQRNDSFDWIISHILADWARLQLKLLTFRRHSHCIREIFCHSLDRTVNRIVHNTHSMATKLTSKLWMIRFWVAWVVNVVRRWHASSLRIWISKTCWAANGWFNALMKWTLRQVLSWHF